MKRANRKRTLALTLAVATVPLWPSALNAGQDSWTYAANGNWSTAADWSLAHQPANGDYAFLYSSSVVTFDAAAVATNLAGLFVDCSNAAVATLLQNVATNGLTVNGIETIGNGGRGVLTLSAGTNTASQLIVAMNYGGSYGGSSGTVTLSGSGVLQAGSEIIGNYGTGVVNQSGGTNTITSTSLILGDFMGSLGTYALSNGATLNVTNGAEYVGYNGNGVFNQTGGTNSATSLYLGYYINIGTNPASSGTFTLGGGTLYVFGSEYIGYNGNGSFNQTGGTHVATILYLGSNANGTNFTSSGTFTLGGGSLTINGGELVGESGIGVFNQNGGTNTIVSGNLTLGDSSGSSGVYNMSNGAMLNFDTGPMYVGNNGSGIFNQTGGSVTALTIFLALGSSASAGTYTLSGGTLSTIGEVIGNSGSGVFSQSGGTNTLTSGSFSLGNNFGSTGSYTLSNSAVLNAASSTEYIGFYGNGVFNQSGGSNAASNLIIGNQSNGTNPASSGTYTLSGGTLSSTYGEIVGGSGNGVFNQSGGTNTIINGSLFLGGNFGATGTYSLSNGATLSLTNGAEYIGYYGNGVFNQTGGTHIASSLLIAVNNYSTNPASSGTFTLGGGTLSVAIYESVGECGNGVFNQSGGTNTVTNGNLTIGQWSSSSGVYNMSNGATLNVTNGTVFVGNNGNGMFNQTGGAVSAASVWIANVPVSFAGSYTLGGGTLFVTNNECVGVKGYGTFNQSGGANTVAGGNLTLGSNTGSTGTYALSNGATVNIPNGSLVVGNYGIGIFNQTGGTVSAGNVLIGEFAASGANPASSGTYTLSGGTLSVAWSEEIGVGGNGVFNQSGGVNTMIWSQLILAGGSGNTGTYALSNGATLSVTNGTEYIGTTGNGVFTQTGGVNNAGSVILGNNASGTNSGLYTLGGGTLSVASTEDVGEYGNGVFNQSGGTHAVAITLSIGDGTGANGTYNMSNGASLSVGGSENIGNSGNGVFTQTGGSNSAWNVTLGNNPASSGTYALSGGTLTVTNEETVGLNGNGVLTQTGGTNNTLYLFVATAANGSSPPSSGTFTLSGGTLSVGYGNAYIGYYGNGVFNMSSSATLSATNATEYVGYYSTGTFTQNGGSNSVANLTIGFDPASTGIYFLNSGSLSVSGTVSLSSVTSDFSQAGGAFNANVVNVNNGQFLLNGGQCTATAFNINSGGTFSQNGGVLNATNFTQNGGIVTGTLQNQGTFTYNSGNFTGQLLNQGTVVLNANFTAGNGIHTVSATPLTINTNITVAANGMGLLDDGTVNLYGTLTTPQAYIGYTSRGTFNQYSGVFIAGSITLNSQSLYNGAGGILVCSNFTQNGGTVTGTLQNQGTFTYDSGVFSGRLLNQGVAVLGPLFTAGNGIENDTTMTLGVGQILTINGQGLENLGTFTMPIATLNGTGSVTNDGGGVMYAAGTISQGLSNYGALNLTGVLNIGAASFNYGAINLPTGGTLRQSRLDNWGVMTFTGGSVASAFSNDAGGVIQGAGSISGAFTNSAGAQIKVASATTFSIFNPWSNAGVVTLQGTGAMLAGGNFTNTGTIQGVGLVSGSVYNTNGVIHAQGGELDLAGTSNTNGPAGQVQISSGSTVFFLDGLASNAGIISLSSGTANFGSTLLTNASTGQILGNGVIEAGGLLNNGLVSFADVASQVYGPVTNAGTFNITSNTTTFYGFLNNASGTVTTTAATARYLAGASIGGTYHSDPSINSFTSLSLTSSGVLQGSAGDQFLVTGDYTSASTQAASWNTLNAQLHFQGGGSHQMAVTGSALTWGQLLIDSANTVNISGTGAAATLTTNSGSITLPAGAASLGTIRGSGSISVGNGGAAAILNASSISQQSLSIAANATVALAINHGNSGLGLASLSTLNSLNITGGTLDLGNNALMINYGTNTSPLPQIAAWVASGQNNPNADWSGTGITSSFAANTIVSAGNNVYVGVGYNEASTIASVAGATTFLGANIDTSSTAVLVVPTLYGDILLQGTVGLLDVSIFSANFNQSTSLGWAQGDFYDQGTVGLPDYSLFLDNFGYSLTGYPAVTPAQYAQGEAILNSLLDAHGSSVPEPASLSLLALGAGALLARRRRSAKA